MTAMLRRVAGLLLSGLVAGCSSGGPVGDAADSSFVQAAGASNAAPAGSADLTAALSNAQRLRNSTDYRVGPLDVLKVNVFQVADLNQTVQVNAVGAISMPLLGDVQVSGMSTPEIERDLTRRLGARYLTNPKVAVSVVEFGSQRVVVDGAVKKPGVVPMKGRMTLVQAIALAEGLTPTASPSSVLVFREAGGTRQVARFDLAAIRRGTVADPDLAAGDVVMVDESLARTTLRDLSGIAPLIGVFRPF